MLSQISLALSMAPGMPFDGSVSTSFAPNPRSTARRSGLIDSGMVRMHSYPFTARDHRQGDAGVAAGGLDDHRLAGLELARSLGRLDHRQPDPVLHAVPGVVALELRDDLRLDARRHAVESNEGRAADEFGHVSCDLHEEIPPSAAQHTPAGRPMSSVPPRARGLRRQQLLHQNRGVAPRRQREAELQASVDRLEPRPPRVEPAAAAGHPAV